MENDIIIIDSIFFTMDILIEHFKQSFYIYKSDIVFTVRIQRNWIAFDKYYLRIENSLYYIIAIILHLSRQIDYLQYNWNRKWVKSIF